MSKNVKIVLNSAGIQELLKSSAIAAVCEREAERMSYLAGVPYKPDVFVGKTRVNAQADVGDAQFGEVRKGKEVKGYWRTLKNGKKVWVNSYKRRT